MFSARKFFCVFLGLISLSVFLFFPKSVFATLPIDQDSPTAVITVSCAGSNISNGDICNDVTASVTINYSDALTGLKAISHSITGDTDKTTCSPTLSTDENNPTMSCSYTVSVPATAGANIDIKPTATDWPGNLYNQANNTIFSFSFVSYSISGTVYNDYNNNGSQDAGDNGRLSETVTLSGASSATATTNASGYYEFTNLSSGNYTITTTVPANYKATTTNPFTVSGLSANTTVNFGVTPLFAVAGNIFIDVNKNQLFDQPPDSLYSSSVATSTLEVHENTGNDPCNSAPLVTSISTATGVYTSGQTIPDGNYVVCYTNKPSDYDMTYLPGSPPYFPVSVGNQPIGCFVGSHNKASCASGNISDLNFGITNSFSWWQCIGADCRKDNEIKSKLPKPPITCGASTIDPYISVDMGGYHGILFSETIDPGSAGGSISNTPIWNINDSFTPIATDVIRTSYSYLKTTARQRGATIIPLSNTQCGQLGIADCDLTGLSSGIYEANGDLFLNAHTFTSGNYIFLIRGSLTIKGNIWVDVGATATFVSSEDININSGVGNSDSCQSCSYPASPTHNGCNVEGHYSADKNIVFKGTNASCPSGDIRVNLAGSFIVNASLANAGYTIQNQRDLCGLNITSPTYTVGRRLDFILNAPEFLKFQNYTWKEAAP